MANAQSFANLFAGLAVHQVGSDFAFAGCEFGLDGFAGQEMVLQELGRYLSELETLPHVRDLDWRELLGQAIRILVRCFATGKGLSQSLIRLCWTLKKPDEIASAVRQVADRLAIFFERIGRMRFKHPARRSCLCNQIEAVYGPSFEAWSELHKSSVWL